MDDTLVPITTLDHVHDFVGADLFIYGPFQPGDKARVPFLCAKVLVNKKKARWGEKDDG